MLELGRKVICESKRLCEHRGFTEGTLEGESFHLPQSVDRNTAESKTPLI